MRQLDHPNIIRLIDFSESKQYYYIVLELAPGGELFHQIVRLTYFSEELSRHVITQVANALEYLHEERGVVHRYVNFSLAAVGRGRLSGADGCGIAALNDWVHGAFFDVIGHGPSFIARAGGGAPVPDVISPPKSRTVHHLR